MTDLPDRFTGTNPDPVNAGEELTIEFSNPELAGTTVTVTVANGEGSSTTLDIPLDSDGKGSKSWSVPDTGWETVVLTQSTSRVHVVAVSPSVVSTS